MDTIKTQQLLEAFQAGDDDARNQLYEILYGDLRDRAVHASRSQRSTPTLQPTALVAEAFVKLTKANDSSPRTYNNRSHFLAVASKAMRQVVVDYARSSKNRHKSGSAGQVELELLELGEDTTSYDVERLHLALEELSSFDAAMALAVEMRAFGGSSVEETAQAVDMPKRTFERKLRGALQWLKKRMEIE